MNLLKKLNKQQQKAVDTDGDILIIAGPGTGKTRTLTHRIAYLLKEIEVNPRDIVALTFTKKAAAEMRERVGSLISNSKFIIPNPYFAKASQGRQITNHNLQSTMHKDNHPQPLLQKEGGKKLPFIGTFHSLAYELLVLQGSEPCIASEKELAEIMRRICGNSSSKKSSSPKENSLKKKDLVSKISMCKISEGELFPEVEDFVKRYNNELQKSGLMDYDDLLIKALETAKDQEIKYEYILVDEFQDTNDLQYRLLIQLLDKKGSIFVIGDPKQSIYAFRGSNEEIFEKFNGDFPDAKRIVLDINYRSGKKIITASSSLFKDHLELKPHKKENGRVKLVETYNQYSEADWVLKEINEKVGGIDLNYAADVDLEKQTSSFADFAVVYRIHSLNNILEKKFYEFGIPFQVIGGQSLYQQKEIKFIILALKYIVFKNITSMNRFIEVNDEEVLLNEVREAKAVDDPASLMKEKLDSIKIEDNKVSSLVKQIVEEFSLEKQVENKSIKLQNLKEFVGSTIRYDKQEEGLVKFLQNIKYLEEHEYYDERADKVTLMTMHAAKGLEFSFVYVIGFEEGIVPYKKSVDEDNLDEEKRLLYVATTRAEKGLHLIHTQKRYGKETKISRFARMLEDLVEKVYDNEIDKIKRKIEKNKKKQLGLF